MLKNLWKSVVAGLFANIRQNKTARRQLKSRMGLTVEGLEPLALMTVAPWRVSMADPIPVAVADPQVSKADFAISRTGGSSDLPQGGTELYDTYLSVTNNGKTAASATIVATAPAGFTLNTEMSTKGWKAQGSVLTLTVTNLQAGKTTPTVFLTFDVDPTVVGRQSFSAKVEIANDVNPTNNMVSWTTNVNPVLRPDFTVAFTRATSTTPATEQADYEIAVGNSGQKDGSTSVTFTAPTGFTLDASMSSQGWVRQGTTSTFKLTINLKVGETRKFLITFDLDMRLAGPQNLTAAVAGINDANPQNNTASVTTIIIQPKKK